MGNICYGAVSDAIDWRWAFLIQAPVIALDAVLVPSVLSRIGGPSWITRLIRLLTLVDKKRQADVQAASGAIMSVGFAVGIVVATAIFQKNSLAGLQGILLWNAGRGDDEMLERVLQSCGRAGDLSSEAQREITGVYLGAVRGVFYLVLGLILGADPSSMLMKNSPLLKKEADDSKSERPGKESV